MAPKAERDKCARYETLVEEDSYIMESFETFGENNNSPCYLRSSATGYWGTGVGHVSKAAHRSGDLSRKHLDDPADATG